MLYFWKLPINCLNKLIAAYDNDLSTDRFLFREGEKLTNEQINKSLIFKLEITQAEIIKYDCIPNNSASPLVNQKIVDILLKLAPDDVQFFDAEVYCKDGLLKGYKLLNITHKIKGIDHDKSIYTRMKGVESILNFKYLTYKLGCMGSHKLARDEESLGNILTTEEVKQAFDQAKIKGMSFVRPEDYYGQLRRV